MLDTNTDLSETVRCQIKHHHRGFGIKFEAITMKQQLRLHTSPFGLQRGETLGIFGPMGSGKTALLKFIEAALLAGSQDARELRLLSITPSQFAQSMARNMSTFDAVIEIFHPADLADRAIRMELKQVLRALLIDGAMDVAPAQSSQATLTEIHLGKALIDPPDVLLLEEPTEGTDEISRERIYRALTQLQNASETTIILTTRDPRAAEQLCDRVIILKDGRVIAFGLPSKLKRLLDTKGDQEAMLAKLYRDLTPEPTWVG